MPPGIGSRASFPCGQRGASGEAPRSSDRRLRAAGREKCRAASERPCHSCGPDHCGITLIGGSITTQITTKGQVTIPQEIRERLGLLPHTKVEFELAGD